MFDFLVGIFWLGLAVGCLVVIYYILYRVMKNYIYGPEKEEKKDVIKPN